MRVTIHPEAIILTYAHRSTVRMMAKRCIGAHFSCIEKRVVFKQEYQYSHIIHTSGG